MKIFLILLVAGLFYAMYYFHNKQIYDASKSEPVKYTQSLQNDVKKAEDAEAKAQAAVNKVQAETQKTSQADQPQPETEPK